MSRDDSSLYSGASSASFSSTKEQQVVKAKREETRAKRQELKPSGQIVVDEIKKELDELIFAPYLGEDLMTDEQFRIERRARRLSVERIEAFRNRIINILRDNKL